MGEEIGGLDAEMVEKALAIARAIDELEASMPPEVIRERRHNAAIRGFTMGVEAGKGPSDALRADVRDWIDNKLTMAGVIARVIDRIKEETAHMRAEEEEAA